MGDIADYLIEQSEALWDDPYYEPEQEGPFPANKDKTCRYCGKGGLFWHKAKTGWRLHNVKDKKIHECLYK